MNRAEAIDLPTQTLTDQLAPQSQMLIFTQKKKKVKKKKGPKYLCNPSQVIPVVIFTLYLAGGGSASDGRPNLHGLAR